MKILTLVVSLLCVCPLVCHADQRPLKDLCSEFNALNTAVRDRTIDKTKAKDAMRGLLPQIRSAYHAAGGSDHTVEWVFPLKGYDCRAVDGGRDRGYVRGRYDYFDGNRHSGHPSLDIFIRDRRQRSLDDRTNEPVTVLSVTGGVVVAAEKEWNPASRLRGGKYLWIYDPASEALVYYAHNSRLLVDIGDIVRPGDAIAQVGRTGFNAAKRRSPTHLHLTYLSLVNGLPMPTNIFSKLRNCRFM